MGNMCGEDTGAGAAGSTLAPQIHFKKTNMHDVDLFFDKAMKLLDDLKDAMDPIDKDEANLYESTGFVFAPNACKTRS